MDRVSLKGKKKNEIYWHAVTAVITHAGGYTAGVNSNSSSKNSNNAQQGYYVNAIKADWQILLGLE